MIPEGSKGNAVVALGLCAFLSFATFATTIYDHLFDAYSGDPTVVCLLIGAIATFAFVSERRREREREEEEQRRQSPEYQESARRFEAAVEKHKAEIAAGRSLFR